MEGKGTIQTARLPFTGDSYIYIMYSMYVRITYIMYMYMYCTRKWNFRNGISQQAILLPTLSSHTHNTHTHTHN